MSLTKEIERLLETIRKVGEQKRKALVEKKSHQFAQLHAMEVHLDNKILELERKIKV
jgi:hypothetical protein